MNIRNCRNCGCIFNYVTGAPLCQACKETLEAKFQEVKEFVRAHPGVSIPEVSRACDVEASQIQAWLREERLEVTEGSAIYLNCEGCGMPIRSGRYCDKCKTHLTSGFRNVLQSSRPQQHPVQKKPVDRENPKMRYL